MVLSLLDATKRVPMTEDQSKFFIDCFMLEKDRPDFLLDKKESDAIGFAGQVFYQRLVWLPKGQGPIKIHMSAALMLISMCKTPSEIVMWAYTVNRMFQKKKDTITLADLSKAFPYGFPSEEETLRIWESQKAPNKKPDNLLDFAETWDLTPAHELN